MATTCKLIAKTTLNNSTNVVYFSNIPQTGYDDLYIVCSARTSNAAIYDGIGVQFNGVSTNLSARYLDGTGSSTATSTSSSGYCGSICGANATANTFGSTEIYIPNYTGSTNKSFSATSNMETNAATSYIDIVAGLWSNTAAITQVAIVRTNADFVSGSTFYLYGITKYGSGQSSGESTFGIQATGGDEVYIANGYKVHVFKSSGTFNVTSPGWGEALIVGGGGGGGSANVTWVKGGGGGAGGMIQPNLFLKSGSHNVVVGGGGAKGLASTPFGPGAKGSDSFLGNLSFSYGGGGGSAFSNYGVNGGSGGGGSTYTADQGAAGITGYGNAGGNGTQIVSNIGAAGGGGGKGSAGSNGSGGTGGNGGLGLASNITGTSITYAGGGGGGGTSVAGVGGSGVGGNGSIDSGNGLDGKTNLGGGGGGGSTAGVGSGPGGDNTGWNGGNGGSGIVIIRYPVS